MIVPTWTSYWIWKKLIRGTRYSGGVKTWVNQDVNRYGISKWLEEDRLNIWFNPKEFDRWLAKDRWNIQVGKDRIEW